MAETLVKKASLGEVARFSAAIRHNDRQECLAEGMSAFEAMLLSVTATPRPLAAYINGRPAGLFGVVPAGDTLLTGYNVGRIWLLTCNVVDSAPLAFMHLCREWLEVLARDFSLVFNLVDARYHQALGWLRRLGFTVEAARPHGPHGLPFHLAWRAHAEAC